MKKKKWLFCINWPPQKVFYKMSWKANLNLKFGPLFSGFMFLRITNWRVFVPPTPEKVNAKFPNCLTFWKLRTRFKITPPWNKCERFPLIVVFPDWGPPNVLQGPMGCFSKKVPRNRFFFFCFFLVNAPPQSFITHCSKKKCLLGVGFNVGRYFKNEVFI